MSKQFGTKFKKLRELRKMPDTFSAKCGINISTLELLSFSWLKTNRKQLMLRKMICLEIGLVSDGFSLKMVKTQTNPYT